MRDGGTGPAKSRQRSYSVPNPARCFLNDKMSDGLFLFLVRRGFLYGFLCDEDKGDCNANYIYLSGNHRITYMFTHPQKGRKESLPNGAGLDDGPLSWLFWVFMEIEFQGLLRHIASF